MLIMGVTAATDILVLSGTGPGFENRVPQNRTISRDIFH